MITLSSPDITEEEIRAVNDVLHTSVLSIGKRLQAFETSVADYVGCRFGIGVSSGTAGLHLAVIAAGIEDGDEVITTPFSFVASSNCILYRRAKPVFVDIDPHTLNMDVSQIEAKITSKTKAIIPVHVFGQPCAMDKITEIANRYNLYIIEDACEALGSAYKGTNVGVLGDCAVFAFYPNKQITTAEGGMIVTDNEEWSELFRSLRNQGRDTSNVWLNHVRLGYNYRLDELSAALGLIQMYRINELLKKRELVAQQYNHFLADVDGIVIPYIAPEVTRMSWFVYVVQFEEGLNRDAVMNQLKRKGIPTRPYFTPIHLQPFYRDKFGFREGDFPVTENVSQRTLALPFHGKLTDKQIEFVCENLKEIVHKNLAVTTAWSNV